MTRKPASKLRIQDDSGRVICNAAELNERVTHHFGQQFNDPRVMELPAFTGVPSPLTMPITPGEVQRAISKLNSGRACGHDDLPADLLKSTADLIAPAIAAIFNDALEHQESLDIGKGVQRAARRGQGGRLTTLNFRTGAVTTLNFFHVLIFFMK